MKYSQRAKREVPVYRIVWKLKGEEILKNWVYITDGDNTAFCYRVK